MAKKGLIHSGLTKEQILGLIQDSHANSTVGKALVAAAERS